MRLYCLLLSLLFPLLLSAQEKPVLSYYLPDISYNLNIPTPAQFLGYEVGEWHASHDQLVAYMRELDRASERITLQVYGYTHEHRPMLCLTITDPSNRARLEEIKATRAKLCDPAQSKNVDITGLPAVNYMGYSIHGNETSGSNAALLVAYYLAAAQTPELEKLLKNTVILFDPRFNPDGMQRFSSWINSRRSQNGSMDPVGDEFNETWPRGRYNHYWFDLNRDWLVNQQPESPGRVAIFQDWHPNVLTDHHEMGSNATFFFQPGVPSRVNPITPARNQELTAAIAQYHARILSAKNIQFFTQESYDDFYYGKGSTYPDANGCVGILFEQASSRGSAQQTDNGLLTFPYTIRNQVLISLSTLQAVGDMRVELNTYLRDFYTSALDEAKKDPVRGYLFADNRDIPGRELLNLLLRHRIDVRNVTENVTVNGQQFYGGNAFWVPCDQPQYRMVKAIFGRQTSFTDSIFYDISAWTIPDAFGLQWQAVGNKDFNTKWANNQPGVGITDRYGTSLIAAPAYAYTFPAQGYDLPNVLVKLQRDGLRVKVAMSAFEADGAKYAPGTLVVPAEKQPLDAKELLDYINNFPSELRPGIITNGLTAAGPDLGSASFEVLRKPEVLLLTGSGVQAESAGEVWHLLDTRYGLSVTLVDVSRFNSVHLENYNVIVLAEGGFSSLSAERMRQFVSDGGTLIAMGSALRWLKTAGLMSLEFRNTPAAGAGRRTYEQLEDDRGAQRLPGAILEATLDLSHPLCFGYDRPQLPMFLGDTMFVETAKNPYATPAVFGANSLLSGYVHARQKPLLANSAAMVVGGLGKGRIICFAGDPNFRAFWYGTNRLFANAVFFGNLIDSDAVERK